MKKSDFGHGPTPKEADETLDVLSVLIRANPRLTLFPLIATHVAPTTAVHD
jgi:hypothetical protein